MGNVRVKSPLGTQAKDISPLKPGHTGQLDAADPLGTNNWVCGGGGGGGEQDALKETIRLGNTVG